MTQLQAAWHRYWYVDTISWSRMFALRWAVFGLVAFDLWSIMLYHASRYGAGGFNVAQIGLLDTLLPVPTPPVISAGVLLTGFFALRAALGVAIRTSMIIATSGYFGIYLWSQADSYQHHYMVGLLMTICCFIPDSVWTLPRRSLSENDLAGNETPIDTPGPMGEADGAVSEGDANDAQSPPDTERARWHWALRLFYVQMALLYFWTAVTKCDVTWLTGITMDQVTSEPAVREFMTSLESRFGLASGESYRAAAWWTMVGEFFAASVFLIPFLRILGMLIVPWFHVGVEVLGFDIELFSYYMIALDLILLTPRSWWQWIDRKWPTLSSRFKLGSEWAVTPTGQWVLLGVGTGATGALCLFLPFSSAATVAGIAAIGTLAALWRLRGQSSLLSASGLHAAAAFLMVFTVQASDSAYDYFRMWGGDLKRRGFSEQATEKYERANALKPHEPARRLQLGRLYERLGRGDDAFALYAESVRIVGAYVDGLRKKTHLKPTDYTLQIDLGQNLLRLASRCKALARLQRQRGLSTEAEESRLCQVNALSDAETAVQRSMTLNPRDQREAFKLRRQLRKARK